MSDGSVTDDVFDVEHVEENYRELPVRYGASTLKISYRPLVAGKRKFQREMNQVSEGFVPDELRERRKDDESEGDFTDRLFFEGIRKVLVRWTIQRGGSVVPIDEETFKADWFPDDILAVIWLAILSDLEPGKAARRQAASLRREVGSGAGFPGIG
jgi:hypothetical protein